MSEHRCEWRMIRVWDGGIVAKCDITGCDKSMGLLEVNRILNEHATLKRATELIGIDEAQGLFNHAMTMQGEAIHGQSDDITIDFWKNLARKALGYIRILSPTNDENEAHGG